jgi:hypothetical protein
MKKIKINEKYKIKRNIMSSGGMLYKDTKVKIIEINNIPKIKDSKRETRLAVEDMMGRIFYVDESDITI